MAQFVFRLQPVLEQREHEERLRMVDLHAAQHSVQTIEDKLAHTDSTIRRNTDELRRGVAQRTVGVAELSRHRRFLAAMKTEVLAVTQELSRARLHAEAARRRLAESARDRKAIELLRDKQLAAWRADQARREQSATDEAGMQIAFANLSDDLAQESAA